MFRKKNTLDSLETVADLRKSIKQSFFSRNKVKVMTAVARTKRAAGGYRIPIIASSIFLIILLSLTVVRQLQRTSLLAIINQATNGTDDYSTLLSLDQADEFTRDDTNEPERDESGTIVSSGESTQSTSTPFVVDSQTDQSTSGGGSGSSSGGGTTSPGGSTGGGNTGGGGGDTPSEPTPPPEPFAASIDSFSRGSTKLDCRNPSNPKVGNCSKVYSFIARVSTSNGPGTVGYTWQSSEGGSNGSITAGEGSTITSVTREIALSCNKPTTFTVQFNLTSPSIANSGIISTNHNCNEL